MRPRLRRWAWRHADPFALLGPRREAEGWVIRARWPGRGLRRRCSGRERRLPRLTARACGGAVRDGNQRAGRTTGLSIDREGVIQETEDPSSFPPLLGELDIYLLRRRAASTTPSSASLLSNTRKLQRSYPTGDWERARALRRPPNQMGVIARPDSGVGRAPYGCPRLARRFSTRRVVFGQSMA